MNQAVTQALHARLKERERLTFAEFMEIALYHPTDGYYNRAEMTIGEGGDFYTSPMVHPVFGSCISRQVWEFWKALDRPDDLFVLEMGAGVGTLAIDLLRTAQQSEAFYGAIRYHIVEQSPVLREKQREHAEANGVADKITWAQTLEEAAASGPQVGVILTNELFDALPVHRLGKTEDGYEEYYVEGDGAGGYLEAAGPLSDPALLDLVDEQTLDALPAGERFVVCPAAGEVIESMGRLLAKGFVLTIDYGDKAPDIYFQHRQADGVRAYYKQTQSDPLQRAGEQDLTADVDFSLLVRRGERSGLLEAGFTDQMHLLGGNGFLQKVEQLRSKRFDLMADAEMYRMLRLFLPQSLGQVFKVLIQAKGIPLGGLREELSALAFSMEQEGQD